MQEKMQRHHRAFAFLFAFDDPERRARITEIRMRYEAVRPKKETPADIWARSSGEQRFDLVEKVMLAHPTWREMTISRYYNAYEASVSRIVRRILRVQEIAEDNKALEAVAALVESVAPE